MIVEIEIEIYSLIWIDLRPSCETGVGAVCTQYTVIDADMRAALSLTHSLTNGHLEYNESFQS